MVGLRPAEVVESVRLLNDKEAYKKYYKPDRSALEHFRFPDVFLRQTKKAYISFVSPSILGIVKSSTRARIDVPSYNAIRLACWSKGVRMDMRFCRKIFASHLRQSGIEAEIVDLLEGRVPRTVFAKHYLTPGHDYKERILRSLEELRRRVI